MQKNIRFLSLIIFSALAVSLFFTPKVSSAKDVTPKCGGVGEKICKPAKATFKGKAINKKPKGAFFDPRKGGEYWKCPKKYKRTVWSVTGKKACEKRLGKTKRAEFKGKVFQKKPQGAFLDPRKGGEYWSCQRGYMRHVTKVTSKNACIPQPKYVCDGKNADIRGKCYKWKRCGRSNERPCVLTERIPSCNKGLAEDFKTNKCIEAKVAVCLGAMRQVRFVLKAAKKFDKTAQKAFNVIDKGQKTVLKAVLGKKNYKKLEKVAGKAAKAVIKTATKDLKKLKFTEEAQKMVKLDTAMIKETTAAMTAVSKNRGAIIKVLSRDRICTSKPAEIVAAVKKAMKYTPDLGKIQTASLGSGPWYKDLLVKSAHAKTFNKTFFRVGYEVNFSMRGSESAVEVYLLTDFNNNHAIRLGLGTGFSLAAVGDNKISISQEVKAGMAFWPNMRSYSGVGFDVSVGGPKFLNNIASSEPLQAVISTVTMTFNDFISEKELKMNGLLFTFRGKTYNEDSAHNKRGKLKFSTVAEMAIGLGYDIPVMDWPPK